MRAGAFSRIAPGGRTISARSLASILRIHDPAKALETSLRQRFPGHTPTFHASGREAMRVAFSTLAARSGRTEIALPAYCCYSLAASAVAAGLRVRLIDVDERGQIAPLSLANLQLERVAALVVGNLFGVPEPIESIRKAALAAGVAVIDDAAQAIGATTRDGPVGGRGDVGVLSFGRGKPISAMGGGALLWREGMAQGQALLPTLGAFERWEALLGALAYDVVRNPLVLRVLASIPALEIGVTTYDPGFTRGAISASAMVIASAILPELDAIVREHQQRGDALAEEIRATSSFEPLRALAPDLGSHPRLALLAPDAKARERALRALKFWGATGMYPGTLDQIEALRPHLVGDLRCPGARDFAARLLTLPTHSGLPDRGRHAILRAIRDCARESVAASPSHPAS